MKIYFCKNNFFGHIVFLTLLLTMASYPKSALADSPPGNHDGGVYNFGPIDYSKPPTLIPPRPPLPSGNTPPNDPPPINPPPSPPVFPPPFFPGANPGSPGIPIIGITFSAWNPSGSADPIFSVFFSRELGGQQVGFSSLKLIIPKTAFNQQNTVLVASNFLVASKNPLDVLSTINNSIGDDISLVEQDTEDLKANLESLLPSENQLNISALAPTNAAAQKLQNSMSGLLKKLNEIPNDNAEVVVAKQSVLNELSKSVVGLEKTNDWIKAINEAVAQSE